MDSNRFDLIVLWPKGQGEGRCESDMWWSPMIGPLSKGSTDDETVDENYLFRFIEKKKVEMGSRREKLEAETTGGGSTVLHALVGMAARGAHALLDWLAGRRRHIAIA